MIRPRLTQALGLDGSGCLYLVLIFQAQNHHGVTLKINQIVGGGGDASMGRKEWTEAGLVEMLRAKQVACDRPHVENRPHYSLSMNFVSDLISFQFYYSVLQNLHVEQLKKEKKKGTSGVYMADCSSNPRRCPT